MEPSELDSATLLRRVAERTTDWRFHSWYWGDAIAVDGLLGADALGAGAYRDGVIETVQRWLHATPPGFDDVLAPGAVLECRTGWAQWYDPTRRANNAVAWSGVTADVLPSWDIRTYERCPTEPSPWGQGVALRALAAMARSQAAGAN